MSTPFAPKFHRDSTATLWDVYTQRWVRTARPTDEQLASLSPAARERVARHVA